MVQIEREGIIARREKMLRGIVLCFADPGEAARANHHDQQHGGQNTVSVTTFHRFFLPIGR